MPRPPGYEDTELRKAVAENRTYSDVLRALGKKMGGGNHAYLRRRVLRLGLDTSHFVGSAWNNGTHHIGGPEKKRWQEVLVKSGKDRREGAVRLRRAMIESGIPYMCVGCGLTGTWKGKPLRLQINHRNTDPFDNRRKNVEFMCPNCHSQTEAWSGNMGLTDVLTDARQHSARRKRRREVNGSAG